MKKVFISSSLLAVILILFNPTPSLPTRTKIILSDWNRQDNSSLNQSLHEIDTFIEHAKTGVPKFTNEAYSIKNKFYSVFSKSHIEELFQKHVMSKKGLEQHLQQVLKTFLYGIQSNKNKSLLKLKYHLRRIKLVDTKKFNLNFQKLLEKHLNEASSTTRLHSIGSELASIVGGEVLTAVTIGIINSILASTAAEGTGIALGGASTFGIGLLVAIPVDWIITHYSVKKTNKKLYENLDQLKIKLKKQLKKMLLPVLNKYYDKKLLEIKRCIKRN